MQRVWPVNRYHLTPSSHMLFFARQLHWKAVAKSPTEQWLLTRALPCLPLDLHHWQLFLAAIMSLPLNGKVCLSLLLCLLEYGHPFFTSPLCSVLQVGLLSFFLIFQSCYWLLIRGKINPFQVNLHGEKQMIASVNSSKVDLSACCPRNIQAARHISLP